MNPPPNTERASPPWVLFVGLALGGALLAFMAWGSINPAAKQTMPVTSEHVIELTNANWQKEVIESEMPVFVDFTAKWCGPCRRIAPIVNALADRFKDKVKICKFDVGDQSFDKGHIIATKYRFNSIPHLMVFKGGRPVDFDAGDRSEEDIASALEAVLAKN